MKYQPANLFKNLTPLMGTSEENSNYQNNL